MEYRISQAMMKRPDFYEGIRAVLVDRDNKPAWAEEAADIGAYFEALGDKELVLPAKVADPRSDAGLITQAAVEAALAKGEHPPPPRAPFRHALPALSPRHKANVRLRVYCSCVTGLAGLEPHEAAGYDAGKLGNETKLHLLKEQLCN